MNKREMYIQELEEFKKLLSRWSYRDQDGILRREINKRIQHVRELVSRAGALKLFTISPPPMVGGLIMKNLDPFLCIFDPPYGASVIPSIIDSIDETIGVIETNKRFSLNPRFKIMKGKKQHQTRYLLYTGEIMN